MEGDISDIRRRDGTAAGGVEAGCGSASGSAGMARGPSGLAMGSFERTNPPVGSGARTNEASGDWGQGVGGQGSGMAGRSNERTQRAVREWRFQFWIQRVARGPEGGKIARMNEPNGLFLSGFFGFRFSGLRGKGGRFRQLDLCSQERARMRHGCTTGREDPRHFGRIVSMRIRLCYG